MATILSFPIAAAATIQWWVWLLLVIIIILLVLLLWWLFARDRGETTAVEEHKAEVLPAEEHKAEVLPVVEPQAGNLVPDDLKIVEGIGPKIEKLLNAAGIHTFTDLASAPVARLQEIMLAANLRIADPTTWPQQAKLAAEGKMEELQAFQDTLKGGRKV